MIGLIRRNRRPTALRRLVSALQRDVPPRQAIDPRLPSHHILCAGTYSPVFARLAAESALAACPPELRDSFRLFIHVDGVAARVRAELMSWLREIPGVELTYGLFGILSADRIPGKWHQVMINDVAREFAAERHLAFIDADLFLVDDAWWRQCASHLADDVYALSVGLRNNSAMQLGERCFSPIRTNLFTLNPALHNALNQQRCNKDERVARLLREEFPQSRLELGNMDTMMGGSLRAQARGYRVIDVGSQVPHCHIGGFSHLQAGKFRDYANPERLRSITGLLAQARLLKRVLQYFDRRGWGERVDAAYRENVARMDAFINGEAALRQMLAEMPPAPREIVFERVAAATGC
jgi:hypothetical protein